MQNLVHISSALTLQKKQKLDLISHISDMSKHNVDTVLSPDDNPEGKHKDKEDSKIPRTL